MVSPLLLFHEGPLPQEPMRVAELYESTQGEGFLTGTASVFVRASGCNLRCWFCDTPHTSWRPEGDDLSVDEILTRVLQFNVEHVVLTGGEPMLFAELIPLSEQLQQAGRHITIETAGTLYLPVRCDLMSVSPKLLNSSPTLEQAPQWAGRHERTRHAPLVIERLIAEFPYQLKFVIDQIDDCPAVETYLEQFPHVERGRVMLMPQGTDPDQLAEKSHWLENYCRQQGLSFCPRKQIEWFGMVRGT
jgi:7-carboxy-7-deazaguanine synthase